MWRFLSSTFGKRALPIALDIGAGGVRMLQLRLAGGRLTALASGRWEFPAPLSGSANPEDPANRRMLVAAGRDMLRKNGFIGRRVVTCLPAGKLEIKNVRLPHLAESELRQAVLWEARERFAFDVKLDHLSCLNAGAVRQGTETRDEIIVLAAPPQAIDSHLALLEEMGLSPDHIDAEPIAMFRSFERFLRRAADEQAVTVVVGIGLSGTRMVVARGRQIIFIKCIDIGGQKFTEAVAKQLNMSTQEAHELRLRVMRESTAVKAAPSSDHAGAGEQSPQSQPAAQANSVSWTVRDAMRAEVEALARELALCLRYCSVTFRGLRCDRVVIVGGEAHDDAVVSLLGEHLGAECAVGQPLKGVDTSGVDLGGDRRGMLAEWSVCAGLAVKGIDVQSVQHGLDAGSERLSA